MDDKVLNKKIDIVVNKNVEKMINEIRAGKNWIDIIQASIKKDFIKAIRIEISSLILVSFLDIINSNKDLQKELNLNQDIVNNYLTHIKKCEMCIYMLFNEIDKICELTRESI